MAVNVDRMPSRAIPPSRPRLWFWALLLMLAVLAGVASAVLLSTQPLHDEPITFWIRAMGGPLLVWCVLGFIRALVYNTQQAFADAWDDARQTDLARRMGRGRRSQQVLAVSLQTALRSPLITAAQQLDALLGDEIVLRSQPRRHDGVAVRHTRLYGESDESLEPLLLRLMSQLLADLAPTLAEVAADVPIALLLDAGDDLPHDAVRGAWQQAWDDSALPQTTQPFAGRGLNAIDQWLDLRIGDRAMLLVVALQVPPLSKEDSAEVVVGLLLGNRLTQATLQPIAYLHRPEQEAALASEELLRAARQALDWVPVERQRIAHAWRSGVDPQRDGDLTTALNALASNADQCIENHNLDASLGHASHASAWLAVASAAQHIERGAGPQLVCSGNHPANAALWCTVLMPVAPL